MYLNQAESEYSEDSSDFSLDDSEGSSFGGSRMWNFGGRKNRSTKAEKSGSYNRSSKRTTQQVLATARAVANDMNHPNQDEVRFVCCCSLYGAFFCNCINKI